MLASQWHQKTETCRKSEKEQGGDERLAVDQPAVRLNHTTSLPAIRYINLTTILLVHAAVQI
jgi:hypothetical protein